MTALLLDAEVVELLRDSPDLLAVADAIAATQPRPAAARRPRVVRFAVLAAALAIAVAAALIVPWQGRGGGFVAKALAALGSGQVIHVVSVSPAGAEIVDIQTGAASPLEFKTEIWFDPARGLERVVSSVDGHTVGEDLQTPAGSWSDAGPVYTCAWIAAHPRQATKLRVSCNASGVNGTTPTKIPEPLPSLDPALAGFVSGYRDALSNGTAVRDGSGTIDGRPVEWLRFTFADQGPPGASASERVERVAVDTATLKPIRVETSAGGTIRTTSIATIETLDPQSVSFERPQLTPPAERPVATSVKSQEQVPLAAASATLGGKLLWSGPSIDGLPFGGATVQRLVTGYGEASGVPFRHSTGVELLYGGPADWRKPVPYVIEREALQPEMMYQLGPTRLPPDPGEMRVESSDLLTTPAGGGRAVPSGVKLWRGILEKDGVYVSLETTSRPLLLAAARQLEAA